MRGICICNLPNDFKFNYKKFIDLKIKNKFFLKNSNICKLSNHLNILISILKIKKYLYNTDIRIITDKLIFDEENYNWQDYGEEIYSNIYLNIIYDLLNFYDLIIKEYNDNLYLDYNHLEIIMDFSMFININSILENKKDNYVW